MTNLKSKKQIINNLDENIFKFVSDANNIIKLLPAEKIEKWTSTENACSFHIKNLTTLSIEIFEKNNFTSVKYKNAIEKPFNFEMIFIIKQIDNSCSETQILFNAELNSTLKFLVSTPLKNLLNIMNENIKTAGQTHTF